MTVRSAAAADHEALLDLWEALTLNGSRADARYMPTPDARAHMRAWTAQSWFEHQPFPNVLVTEADGALTGFVHAFPRSAVPVIGLAETVRIADLYVAEPFRRRGLARTLVEGMLRRAEEAGYPRAEVGTLTADEGAVGFWRTMGFGDWQVTLSRG